MADNFAFTQGSGTTGAADDIGGVLYPRVKLTWGPDGTANDADTASGKALPVQLRNSSGTEIGTSGNPIQVTLANTGANSTAVKVDNSAVTQPVSAASLPLPSGAATAAKQPALGTAGTPSSDVITVQGTASMTAVKVDGSAVTQPVSISGNQAVNLTQVAGASTATGHGTASGALRVELPTDGTGLVTAAQSGTWTVQPGNTANTTPWLTTQSPATSGGLSIYSGTIGATATAVKASAGQLYGWYIYNPNTSAVYVQIFNVASGSVTLGTTSPTMSLGIPASGGANVEFVNGIAFGTAVTVAVTTTRSGSTGPSSTVDLNILYK